MQPIYAGCFEVCVTQRFHLQVVCALVLYPAKNVETYGIFSYIKDSSCHVTFVTFKKKTSTCGSYVGHIRIVLWVSGSKDQQVRPTFNPDLYSLKGSALAKI